MSDNGPSLYRLALVESGRFSDVALAFNPGGAIALDPDPNAIFRQLESAHKDGTLQPPLSHELLMRVQSFAMQAAPTIEPDDFSAEGELALGSFSDYAGARSGFLAAVVNHCLDEFGGVNG